MTATPDTASFKTALRTLSAGILRELRLVCHPMSAVTFALGALVLVPSWPYLVILFYTCLAAFFNAANAREVRDLDFAITLPLARRDIVRSRIAVNALMQLGLLLLMLVCTGLRGILGISPGEAGFVGMAPNIALVGCGLVVFTAFDLAFFPLYWRNPRRVGIPFVLACIPAVAIGTLFEAAGYIWPWFSENLAAADAPLAPQLAAVGIGLAAFVLATAAACHLSARTFERADV